MKGVEGVRPPQRAALSADALNDAEKVRRLSETCRYLEFVGPGDSKPFHGVIQYQFTGFADTSNLVVTLECDADGYAIVPETSRKLSGIIRVDADTFLGLYDGEVKGFTKFCDYVMKGKIAIDGPWGAWMNVCRFGNTVDYFRWDDFYAYEEREAVKFEKEAAAQTRNLLYKITSCQEPKGLDNRSIHSLDPSELDFEEHIAMDVAPKMRKSVTPAPSFATNPVAKFGELWRKFPARYLQTPFTTPERFLTYTYFTKFLEYRRNQFLDYLWPSEYAKKLLQRTERWAPRVPGSSNEALQIFEEYDHFLT